MKHYYSLNEYLRGRFGCKVYKLSLDGGFTCPNRDGTLDTRGCIFCSGRGSGEFAVSSGEDVAAALERAKTFVGPKAPDCKYIAYFQSFTGTYAPLERLERLYRAAIAPEDILGLSVATRPDCLGDGVIELLTHINRIKPVWVELGLQTVHEDTARYIRRGYELPVFDDALRRLKAAGLQVVVHMIIGLPGETDSMIYETARYIGRSGAHGVKFQLLHVQQGTDLAEDYRQGLFDTLSMEEYARLLAGCIKRIPPETVVHRITGDGDKRILIAPLWSGDKKRVLNYVNQYFDSIRLVQGSEFLVAL